MSRSFSICSQECTFTNTENPPVFYVREMQKIIYKHIRKYIDIYERL